MPPKSKLSDAQIAALEKWVTRGAPDPRPKIAPAHDSTVEEFDIEKRYHEHWSWRPVQRPTPPGVQNAQWTKNEIDHFYSRKTGSCEDQPRAFR